MADPGIAGAGVVDLVAADEAERNQRWDAQRRGTKKYRALGNVLAGGAHGAGGQRIAGGIEGIIAPGARRHGAASDQAETDGGDRRGDDAAGDAVQHLGDEDQSERRRKSQYQGGARDGDNADRRKAAFPGHPIDERSARQVRDQAGNSAG